MFKGDITITGLFGNPVAHSLSPCMQNAGFRAAGYNCLYLPFQVQSEHLSGAVKAIVSLGMAGVNVTAPHKEDIVPYMDELSSEAALLKAVNTVVNVDGKLNGYNTDVDGFQYLLENASIRIKGEKVCLLGAGGAAKAISLAVAKAGASSIAIANRSMEKAEALRNLLCENGFYREKDIELTTMVEKSFPEIFAGSVALINCTSVDPVENSLLSCRENLNGLKAAIDLRYSPAELPFLNWASEAGLTAVNGINMLLGQGIKSFEIFTGRKAPVAAMKNALSEECS